MYIFGESVKIVYKIWNCPVRSHHVAEFLPLHILLQNHKLEKVKEKFLYKV